LACHLTGWTPKVVAVKGSHQVLLDDPISVSTLGGFAGSSETMRYLIAAGLALLVFSGVSAMQARDRQPRVGGIAASILARKACQPD
jgi:hypothetical protein